MGVADISSKGGFFMRTKKCFTFAFLLLSAFALSLGMTTNDFATERGISAYPNGAEDFWSGAVPPPGTYFINYFTYYTADDFNDKNGDSAIPGWDLNLTANIFRFIHITKYKILGGFWGMHVFLPFLNVDVETETPLGSDNKAGFGDIIVDPFILSWHSKNWHFATGLDIYIPTGDYDKEDLANTGRNYWTFEPIVAFTYESDSGFEVSSKFMYDFNTENDDSLVNDPLLGPVEGEYLSGQEFHFDYTIGYKLSNWRIGIGGYYYKQTTKDEFNDEKVGDDGNKGQSIAVGPQLKYDYKNMSFILKYHKEMEVENRPEGQAFWFKFVYAF